MVLGADVVAAEPVPISPVSFRRLTSSGSLILLTPGPELEITLGQE